MAAKIACAAQGEPSNNGLLAARGDVGMADDADPSLDARCSPLVGDCPNTAQAEIEGDAGQAAADILDEVGLSFAARFAAASHAAVYVKRSPLSELLQATLREHGRAVAEVLRENELLRRELRRLSKTGEEQVALDVLGEECDLPLLGADGDMIDLLPRVGSKASAEDMDDLLPKAENDVSAEDRVDPLPKAGNEASAEDMGESLPKKGNEASAEDTADLPKEASAEEISKLPSSGQLSENAAGQMPMQLGISAQQPGTLLVSEQSRSERGGLGNPSANEPGKKTAEENRYQIDGVHATNGDSGHGNHRHSIEHMVETLEEEEEKCAKFMRDHFESITSMIIVLNIIFMFVQLIQQGKVAGAKQGFTEDGGWPAWEAPLHVSDHVFNAIFFVELVIRIGYWRTVFFCNKKWRVEWSNMFDLSLVVSSCIDLYVIQTAADAVSLSIFRPLRFFRLLRTLRILQLFKSLLPLRVLVKAVAASFVALFWSISLLYIIMLLAALFLCQLLTGSLEDEAILPETREWIYKMYGTSPRSCWTVFELTFSGGWPNYVRILVEEVSPWYAVFFNIYVISVIFALFRIVSALFLKDTLAAAAADAEVAIVQKAKQKKAWNAKMIAFFRQADESGDGLLTREEFDHMMEDPEVQNWFSVMDVDYTESAEFFELLACHEGKVSAEDFVNGIPRLKGQARSQDVVAVRLLSKQMQGSLKEINAVLREFHKFAARDAHKT